MTLRVRYWDDFLCPWCWIGSVRRERAARDLGPRVVLERRAFLLLPGWGQRPVHDAHVIAHRIAAAEAEPGLGFTIPEEGTPYPRSSLPAQLVAARVKGTFPERLRSLEQRLFHAVFVRLEDVSDRAILRRCSETAGVPPEEVDAALDDRGLVAVVKREHAEASALGIEGVPALAIEGQEPIVGAVSEDALRLAFRRGLSVGQRLPKAG